MRVLLTTDTVGGVWTYTKELTEGLLEKGHEVSLVSVGRLPSAAQSAWCTATATRFSHHFEYTASDASLEWMDANDRAYTAAEQLLLDKVDAFRPDLLHTNQFCFGALPVAIPKLVVAHSDVLSWAAACRPDGLPPCAWLDQYISLVDRGLRHADAVAAPTHWMLRALAQNFSLPSHARAIHNGRDLPPATRSTPRKLQAVSIGRLWDEAKGIATLREISSPLPVFLAGEPQLHAQSPTPDLAGAQLLGLLSEDDLLDLLRSSSIYLALSLYEPFGLAPLEAALCGCAVVARDLPSFREVWGPSAAYFDDAPSLQLLLTQLVSNPHELSALQSRSHVRALELSRTRMTELYLDLYTHLLTPQADSAALAEDEVPSFGSKLRIAYFAHSLRSDWNNGNAHFLRGLCRALGNVGHTVTIFEPETEWSIDNLRSEALGESSLTAFSVTYPDLAVETYSSLESLTPQRLEATDIVILHEWSPPELANHLLHLRQQLGFRLLFHDTHHRASSSPQQIELFQLTRFDGILAFGRVLEDIYRNQFHLHRVWTLHEAADTTVFCPPTEPAPTQQDVVWIGNWGDGERSEEIREFLLQPVSQLPGVTATIFGVRYPEDGLSALRSAGVQYGGYLPNLQAPSTYAASRLTVHIPRRQYASAMVGIPTIRVFEALACGIPLLSAPWHDTEDLFRPGDFRFVSTSDEMRQALHDLLANPRLAAEQAARGRETVLARHTCHNRALELTSICEELLS